MLYDLLGHNLSETTLELLAKAERHLEHDTPLEPLARVKRDWTSWAPCSPSSLVMRARSDSSYRSSIENVDDAIEFLAHDPDYRLMLTGLAWHLVPKLISLDPWSIFRVRVRDRDAINAFDTITMIPRVPWSPMGGEDRVTPRIPMAMSVSGAMASMVIHDKLTDNDPNRTAIEVFSNIEPVTVLRPSVFEVPDAWATEEVWSIDPMELTPYWRIEGGREIMDISDADRMHRSLSNMDIYGPEGTMVKATGAIESVLERIS